MKSSEKKIAIIDYGLGNLHSLIKAVERFTDDYILTNDAQVIERAQGIFLPGVGAFAAGMAGLKEHGLIDLLKRLAAADKPMLGICLGAQMLLSEGHEFGAHQGLDIIPGKVVKFNLGKEAKVPQIGWNKIYPPDSSSWHDTILADNKSGDDMYFVHSYIMQPEQKENILCETTYEDYKFCSAVRKGNVYGCQFHPEKSGEVGLRIIHKFIDMISSGQ